MGKTADYRAAGKLRRLQSGRSRLHLLHRRDAGEGVGQQDHDDQYTRCGHARIPQRSSPGERFGNLEQGLGRGRMLPYARYVEGHAARQDADQNRIAFHPALSAKRENEDCGKNEKSEQCRRPIRFRRIAAHISHSLQKRSAYLQGEQKQVYPRYERSKQGKHAAHQSGHPEQDEQYACRDHAGFQKLERFGYIGSRADSGLSHDDKDDEPGASRFIHDGEPAGRASPAKRN